MTARRRRRVRGVAWALMALGVLATAGWALTGWAQVIWELKPNVHAVLSAGCVEVRRLDPAMAAARSQARFGRVQVNTHWDRAHFRFDFMRHAIPPSAVYPTAGWDVLVPVYWLGPALGAAGLALLFAARRRAGGCDRCGYPRAGLADGAPCPECGLTPDVAPGGTSGGAPAARVT